MKCLTIRFFLVLNLVTISILNAQTQIGSDIDGLLAGDFFGHNVSISSSGNIVAIVGNGGTSSDGRVRVFQNLDGVWTLYGNDQNGENFAGNGSSSLSLSSDGNTIALGGWDGVVRVYSYNTQTEIWTQQGNDIQNTTSVGAFGYSIKLSANGNTVVIGTPAPPNVPEAGVTQVFHFNNNTWNQIGNDINGLTATEHSGRSVDMTPDGSTIAILNDNSVRIYQNIANAWTLTGSEIPAIGSQSPNKAISLSSDGEVLAIGEPDYNDNGVQRGRVRVFRFESDVWVQIGNQIEGESIGDRAGWSVALSSNGNVLAFGEIDNSVSADEAGRVRIFKNELDVWTPIGNSIFGESVEDHFGWSLSLSSNANTLVVGTPLNDGNASNAGHARVYDLRDLLSVNNFETHNIKIYPNPTEDFIRIETPESYQLKEIHLFNNLGHQIGTFYAKTINLSQLSSGLYYLEIVTNNGSLIKEIVRK